MKDFLSLNSSKGNLVKSVVATHGDMFKGKDKKNQKLSYPRQQNQSSHKIQNQRGCTICAVSRGTKYTSIHFTKDNPSQTRHQ